ncbi:hypothetical protein INT48_008098, partial [Thamnidium elegans]
FDVLYRNNNEDEEGYIVCIYHWAQCPQRQQQFSAKQQQNYHQSFPSIDTPISLRSTDPVGNRLSKYHSNWTEISINSFVNSTIQHGYHIPFHTPPPVTTTPTPIIPFSDEQSHLIDQAIQDLLQKEAIEKVSPQQSQLVPGFYSSMFVIPKKNGGVRPVFNLKKLNQYLDAPHFKMETIREVSLMVNPNDYLVSIDLSDAFLHVGLHPDSRRFLRLKWKNQVYQYCTTAFGLSSSPFVFTKVCRPILEHFRSQGYKISAYLDDWILAASSKELAMQQVQQVVDLLQHLGWIVNGKKSVLNPTQQLEHLGYILNTQTMTASLPLKKLRDIRRSIKQVLDKPHRQSPRVIHSLTMRIQAATFAIFPARLYTRHLLYYKNQMVKNDRDWDLPRPLDKASLDELNWWYLNLQKWNGRSLLPTTPTQTIFVDASNTGWGCSWKTYRAHGYWTTQEAAQSINWRELKAAHLALTTFQVPQNSTILIRTDNTTSLSYINKQGGTRSLPLMELATEVWNWCLANNIHIQAQHIRGIHNNIADMESRRTFFKNQWQLKPKAFQTINHLWGPHSIDLFADRTTKLLPKYVSWMPDPGAIHTDAFTIPWNIWTRPFANPPYLTNNNSCTPLAQCNLVSLTSTPSVMFSPIIDSPGNPDDFSENSSSLTTSELDTLRMEIIRAKLVNANLNEQANQDILDHKFAPTITNKMYRKNQLRFIDWAYKNQVSFTDFSGADMVNFLASMRQEHTLQVSTLKTLRAAATHLHTDSSSISTNDLVNNYLDSIIKQAPPVSIHREPVDMTPSLAYARTILSCSTTSLKPLQQKLAFLLSMAAFLRPSDLARIPFSSCNIRPEGSLTFQVVAPKETRKKRRIIKSFTVHPHNTDIELCPVRCFKALRDHSSLASRSDDSHLFVKSHIPSQPLSSTLSTWLHREFISLSTSESRVTMRSLASSRALDKGVSIDNIVSLGNWASSSTFQDHYRRNQMATVDFTSTVLSGSFEDKFFDASDTLD